MTIIGMLAPTPDRVAAICGEASMTYQELAERSSGVARFLVSRGPLVALRMERSLDILVGLLGILKAGAAYLPLTSAWPAVRTEFVLSQAKPGFVLESLVLEPDGELPEVRSSDLAYVMYTSGSTGQPKGVCVEHGSVASLLRALQRVPGITADDVLVAVTPITFDMSVPELLLPLTVGATTVLATSAQARDGRELLALLRRSRATVLQATPATFRLLLEAGWAPGDTPGLRAWCGGEHFSRELAGAILERAAELWNCYGPTEATVYCSIGRVLPGQPVLMGPALAPHSELSVEEEELVVRGPAVARGYLGAPFQGCYRTGDRVRAVGEGFEFLGRFDDQLKLRGYRIEPAEVEAALASHPTVSACAVGARGERLIAWVVARGVAPEALRFHVAERLPGYMVPSVYQFMSALPLNPSGKVDRAALPSVEERVAEVFRELVGDVGHFFELGGDSLLAAQAAALLGMRFQVELPPGVVFDRPTVQELAALLEAAPWARPLPADGGLSFAQERWLFLERLGQGQALRRTWQVRGVDADRLAHCMAALVERHEALRTVFPAGRPVVLPAPPLAGPLDVERGPVLTAQLESDELRLTVHHIAADRQSLRLLVEELGALYAGRSLPEPGASVSAFAAWERARLTPERLAELEGYWRTRLAGASRLALFGTSSARLLAPVPSFSGVTPFVVTMAAFQLLLSRWTGQTDVIVGFPVALRERAEFERTVGCLVNVLPLRADLTGDPTFGELLDQVAARVREALAHQDLPFEKLVECVAPARDGRHPLFTVMLAMDAPDAELVLAGAEVTPLMVPPESPLGLTLTVLDGGETLVEGAPDGLFSVWPALLAKLSREVRLSELPGNRAPELPEETVFVTREGNPEVEARIARIWQEVLGCPVGPDDNFFALGGHSLLALRAVIALEKALRRSIPLSVLFEAQSPRLLAAALEDSVRLSSSLVVLSPGVGPPLYCVHPNRGTVQIYRHLAERLRSPVWGFEMVRRPDGRLRHDSVAEMAGHYVDELLRAHPKGPHHLAGVSLGGRIAYEMALILRERGQPAGLTVLLDTWGPGYPRALPLAELGQLTARERLSYATKRLHNLRDRLEEGVMRTVSRMPVAFPREWERVGARPFLEATPLRSFPGRLHLFRAQEQPFGCVPEPTLGWGPYAEDLVIVEVPGYHERMLQEPHVDAVARRLEELLCFG